MGLLNKKNRNLYTVDEDNLIMKLISEKKTNKQIAEQLGRSVASICYRRYRKLEKKALNIKAEEKKPEGKELNEKQVVKNTKKTVNGNTVKNGKKVKETKKEIKQEVKQTGVVPTVNNTIEVNENEVTLIPTK